MKASKVSKQKKIESDVPASTWTAPTTARTLTCIGIDNHTKVSLLETCVFENRNKGAKSWSGMHRTPNPSLTGPVESHMSPDPVLAVLFPLAMFLVEQHKTYVLDPKPTWFIRNLRA
jgi:hypothetical protein